MPGAASRSLLFLRRLPHPHFQAAAATRYLSPTFASAEALLKPSRPYPTEPPLCVLQSGFTSDGNFNRSWRRRLGSTAGAVLIGQAAFFLGLSNGSALAQEDSVSLGATTSEQAEGNATGLQRIEDGSVISNEHTVKWRIHTNNARVCYQKRQLDQAEKLFQAALHEAKEGFGLRDPHVASALNNLAEIYRLRKEYEKAELLYLEAIKILEESLGSDDIRVGTALQSLGKCYYLQQNFTQAQICYECALKIEGRVMGVGHPEYASIMFLLAKVLSLQGKRKDAESLTEESIRILEEAGLGESLRCIQRMAFLSMELVKSKRFDESENWQRKILHALELSKGWDSLETTHAAQLLSTTLHTLGKWKESEELLEKCLAVRKKILPEDHFLVAAILAPWGRLTLHKLIADLANGSSDAATYYLAKAKHLINESIRITEGVLNGLSKDLKELNNMPTADRDKILATAILIESLHLLGITELVTQHTKPEEQEHRPIEQALHKFISLYKERHTRKLVLAIKQDYLKHLRGLISLVHHDFMPQTVKLQELLDEAQRVMEELSEETRESNRN